MLSSLDNITSKITAHLGFKKGKRFGDLAHDTLLWGTAAAVMSAAVMVSPAFSQKLKLHPQSDWSVSHIDASAQAGSKPYCVMARKFNNNVILSVAKNSDGQKSLAIDFQNPRLSTDRSYQLIMKAGDAIIRGFEVSPVTNKAFVIRMGEDKAFFDALERGERLTINYGFDELSFDLSQIAAGTTRLENCVSKGASPRLPAVSAAPRVVEANATSVAPVKKEIIAASQNAAAAKAAQPSSYIQQANYVKKADSALPELTTLVAAPTRKPQIDVSSIEPAAGGGDDVNDPIIIAADTSDTSGGASPSSKSADNFVYIQSGHEGDVIKSLRSQIQALQAENRSLRSLSGSQTGSFDALKSELDVLKSENEVLKSRLTAAALAETMKEAVAKATKEVEEKTAQQIALLQKQNDDLSFQLQELSVEKQALLAASNDKDQIMQENDELSKRLARLESEKLAFQSQSQDVELMRQTIESLRKDVSELSQQKTNLQAALTDARGTLTAVQKDGQHCLSSTNWDLEKATRRYQEAQREIERLGASLHDQRQTCRSEISDIESQLLSVGRGGTSASQAQTEKYIEMRQKLMELTEDLKAERLLSKRKVTTMREELDAVQNELKAVQEELFEARNQVQQSHDELARTTSLMTQQQAELRDELGLAQQEVLRLTNDQINSLRAPVTSERPAQDTSYDEGYEPQSFNQSPLPLDPQINAPSSYQELNPAGGVQLGQVPTNIVSPRSDIANQTYGQGQYAATAPQGTVLFPVAALGSQIDRDAMRNILGHITSAASQAGQAVLGQVDVFEVPQADQSIKQTSLHWDMNGLLGSADVYKMPVQSFGTFQSAIQQYVAKSQSYCQGQFSLSGDGDAVIGNGERFLSLKKFSCEQSHIPGQVSYQKSILFAGDQGGLTIMSHEGDASQINAISVIHNQLGQTLAHINTQS